jgi:glycosyltransferase involved in cell wall biosynthesis
MSNSFIVLLSTFNGEKYLEELLESLEKQENVEFSVIVRDDGSTDHTLQILESFKERLKIELHVGANVGSNASYKLLMNLAQNRNFDYIAFCDQDDVWLPDKLNRGALKLAESKKSHYSSKRLCFSGQGNKVKLFPKVNPVISFSRAIFENYSAGCTFIISQGHFHNLMRLGCTEIRGNYDHIMQVMSVIQNKSFFDSESRICYRLHSENTIGVLRLRDRRISKTAKEIQYKLGMLEEIVARMGSSLTIEDQNFASKLLSIGKDFKQSLWILKLPRMRHKRFEDVALKFFLLFKTG